MDKKRARITIKLGQANEPVKKENSKEDIMITRLPLASNRSEPEEKEQVVESFVDMELKEPDDVGISRRETAASEEDPDEVEDNWYGPKYTPSNRRKYKSRLKHNRERNSKGMLGIIASVTGAVAVGLMFGYIVLSFFESGLIQQPSQSAGGSPSPPTEEKSTEVEGAPKDGADKTQTGVTINIPEETESVSIMFPSTTHYVVQGGVFKDQASAAPIVENLKSKGWPNSFLGENPAHLILGLAVNRDHALSLAGQFKDIEVYIKELTGEPQKVSVAIKKGSSTTQDEWDHWFKQEQTFVEALSGSISSSLTTGKLDDNQMKAITDSHRNLLQYGREIVGKLPESKQSLGNRMLNDFTKGVTAMEQYQKQPTVGYLWQAEQALLDAFSSKQQLISSFK